MDGGYISAIGWWAIIGYFFGPLVLPRPESRGRAWLQVALMGPLAWMFFLPIALHVRRQAHQAQSQGGE